MSQDGVKKAVAKIFSDANFKKAFERNPQATLEKAGFALTPDEITAISKIKLSDLKVNIIKGGIGPRSSECCVSVGKSLRPGSGR
jgi:hypothetical protein